MKKNNKTNNAIMEFVKMTIKEPSILEDSENAQKIAYEVLEKNKRSNHIEDIEKNRA